MTYARFVQVHKLTTGPLYTYLAIYYTIKRNYNMAWTNSVITKIIKLVVFFRGTSRLSQMKGPGGYSVERWVRGCAAQIGCIFSPTGFSMTGKLNIFNWVYWRSIGLSLTSVGLLGSMSPLNILPSTSRPWCTSRKRVFHQSVHCMVASMD